jgi:hypothetical protein
VTGEGAAVVEYWRPQVGQRVRIRWSPECRADLIHRGSALIGGLIWMNSRITTHQPDEEGRTGRVTYVNPTRHPALKGHWYTVALDEPLRSNVTGERQYTLDYCAAELDLVEPLATPPAAD